MTPLHRKPWLLGLLASLLVGLGAVRWAQADDPTEESRYPYDPVCSWGRLADGKGMMTRCLSRAEAELLLKPRAPAPPDSPAPVASVGIAGGGESSPSPYGSTAPAPTEFAAISVEVGPLVADSGKLPLGEKKLREPKDRYLECVQKNGGLTEATGEVVVRFLVRERGRAEGVSVSKRRGVSKAAARCVSSVVDRRAVGAPDEPMVGASLTLTFSSRTK